MPFPLHEHRSQFNRAPPVQQLGEPGRNANPDQGSDPSKPHSSYLLELMGFKV